MQNEEVEDSAEENNSKALVNVAPTNVAARIAAIPPEVLLLNEEKLEHHARAEEAERRLRAAFQLEYERAIASDSKMEMKSVYRGIVTSSYFFKYIIGNSYKLAYIIKPYTDHRADMEDLLRMGLDDMRTIMKRPVVNSKGEFDPKLAKLKHEITKDLLDRTRGSAARHIQIDQKSMVVTKDITEKPESIEDINRRLQELEAKDIPQITYKDVSNGSQEE